MAAGGSDVTVSGATSRSDDVARERPEVNRSNVVGDEVGQLTLVTSSTSTASVVSAASASMLSSSSASAGNGSKNREACGFLMSVGRRRENAEELFRPTSTLTALSRARTLGPVTSRPVTAGRQTPVTASTGVHSTDLRQAAAAAARASSRSPVGSRSPEGRSSVVSPSAAVDRRSDVRAVPGQAPVTHGLVRSVPGRSSLGATSSVSVTSSSTVQPRTAGDTELDNYTATDAVSRDPRMALAGGPDCFTAMKRSVYSPATVDSYATSPCPVSTAGDASPSHVNLGAGRASASPQLRRWNGRWASGSQSSAAVQAGTADHHHHHQQQQQQQQEPERDTKPHSVPCSPRLQARLTATQPWRPWSPSSKSSAAGFVARPFQTSDNDPTSSVQDGVSQLASSLLLSKVIRERQEVELFSDLNSRGNYAK